MENREWEVNHSESGFKGKTIQDFLYFEGMFNPVARFAFTNDSDEPFVSYWNSQPYKIAPHATVKLTHHLAVKFTKEFVDKKMQAENKSAMMAVPAMRKPYEDKVLKILPEEQNTELEIIRNDFVEQINRDANRPVGVTDEQSPAESLNLNFDDLRNRVEASQAPEAPAVKKMGRPKKS